MIRALYLQGIVHGEVIWLARQVLDDKTGPIVDTNINTQTR